ncbi:MAG TPA: UDP-N-acetylglucosamine 2-epimerase (non-hydrolyzing) [Candidatus Limiplasma sp.]|nr:UDP-N-acetylglucosamine 2-epimerase (non-hydrolyzing) [Candidatus Limiplasma sp.]HRX08461.1 UDP-N-acetylglucosamine 2-epimerase (non-hydrolyzing) [Candidatus Limiplasma sp.]
MHEQGKVKALIVFGTRPEAIKMCPVVKEFRTRSRIDTKVCVTGQHREMLDQVLTLFDVVPDYDLDIMQQEQSLFDITSRTLTGMQNVLADCKPDIVLVHGDTTTAFATSLAALYMQIPVGHVEAGLRTHNIYSPFPEEYNRQAISLVAKYHFSPTQMARYNLRLEGRASETIYVTGNTGIDALKTTVRPEFHSDIIEWGKGSRLLVMTAHRRENIGDPMRSMFRAVRRVLEKYEDVKLVYPIHKNPVVRKIAYEMLSDHPRIRLIEPMEVDEFHNLINAAYFILTDSGGIQEEAPSLGKPVLVMRDTTERPEGLDAGTLRLVGTDEQIIFYACRQLLDDPDEYQKMSTARNPYGDGTASMRIADVIEKML